MRRILKSQNSKPRNDVYEQDYKLFTKTLGPKAKEVLNSLLTDVHNNLLPLHYGRAALRRDLATIYRRIDHEGLEFCTLTLPKLWEGLSAFMETGRAAYPGFKLQPGTNHPLFLKGLFSLACNTEESEVKGKAIGIIYQISVIFTKLKGPYPESVVADSVDKFIGTDTWLSQLDVFSDDLMPIVNLAKKEITSLLKGLRMDKCVPRPGPGATNAPVNKRMRYRPHAIYTQIEDTLPLYDWFYVHPWDITQWTSHYRNLPVYQYQTARYKTVHKKVGKPRGICIEENETQWLQQAFKNALYDWVENHPLTKGKINFRDQSVNAQLALLYSVSGEGGTIDMSEASDRILRTLVSYLFRDTLIHDELLALSTRVVQFDEHAGRWSGTTIGIAKYAPMGSGLCFPIMSLVHWALIRAIARQSSIATSKLDEVYVYGDDILLPVELVEKVYDILPRFGMKLNTEKSFYRCRFRESCGVHAYNGVDITPVYIKYLPFNFNAKHLMSCISAEYQFERKGYAEVGKILRSYVQEHVNETLPIVPKSSPEFGFKRDGQFDPIRRVPVNSRSNRFGETQCRIRTVCPVNSSDIPPTEYEAYVRHVCLGTNARFVDEEPQDISIKWQWTDLSSVHGYPNANVIGEGPLALLEENNYALFNPAELACSGIKSRALYKIRRVRLPYWSCRMQYRGHHGGAYTTRAFFCPAWNRRSSRAST